MAVRMDLHVLPNRLRLASFRHEHLPCFTHPLLKFLVFPTEPDRFVSLIETDDEISLVVEEEYLDELQRFNSQWLEVEPATWRALQLSVGTAGETSTGIVSSLARPLADHDISIFQLSTYDSDYALVEEPKLLAAIDAIKEYMDVNVIWLETGENNASSHREGNHTKGSGSDDITVSPTSDRPRTSKRNIPVQTESSTSLLQLSLSVSPPKQQCRRRRPFTVTQHSIYLGSIDRDNIELVAGVLIRLLFYTAKKRFFSITRNDEMVTVMLDAEAYRSFPEQCLNVYPEAKVVVRVADGPLGFEECGIVADFASTLANENISIFYVSTFLTDYILIGSSDIKRAVSALTRHFASVSAP